jgi:diguanylate cyclase (GGDEF)-like protein
VRIMESTLGLRASKTQASPLESETFRAQQAESGLQQLGRSEWWLWLSALLVTVLSATAFVLTAIPSYFRHSEHFYEIRSDQARWGILCLLLLFNGWLVYRQWKFRRRRRELSRGDAGCRVLTAQIPESPSIDMVTGLHTRAFIEQQLGKEIARAKRQKNSLSLATIHLDEFAEIAKRYGPSVTDAALKELAQRLKKACRGSDFAVRLANDDFLLVLPECDLGEVKIVLNRLGSLEIVCSGLKVDLAYTTGWVDYQPGDLPSDLLERATQLLHLYENAAKDSFSSTLAPH